MKKTMVFSTTAAVDSPIRKLCISKANVHALQQHKSKNRFFIPRSLLPLPPSHFISSQTGGPWTDISSAKQRLPIYTWEQSKWLGRVLAVKSHHGIYFTGA